MAKSSNGIFSNGAKLTTPVFRLSFPKFFVAEAMEEGGSKKFGCQAIWTPAKFTAADKALWKALLAEMDSCSMGLFKKHWKDLPAAAYKKGIRSGMEKEELAGYGEGTRFASLSSAKRPGVILAKDKTPISPDEGNEDLIYPGCYCQATVGVFSYNKGGGKGVSLSLRNVRKIKNGDRLDNQVDAEDDFDEEADAEWLDQEDETEDGDDEDFD